MTINRRKFISTSAAAVAGTALAPSGALAKSIQNLRVGMIGCGGRSKSLVREFGDHCKMMWGCDPDARRLAEFQKRSGCERTTADLREVIDDDSIDAVIIATPDHWHAPAAIMACDAGKHVYVEKPCSHKLRESQLLLEAARRNEVVVQHGTQSRNNPFIAGAIRMIRDGMIGDVLVAKAWNIQRRENIGRMQPTTPPPHVDYDLWMPFQQNRFHYDWHWWFNFGTGDIGNDGTHELDIARWGLGTQGLPATATALGGKFYFDDDQQFPDTATCTFQWGDGKDSSEAKQLIFEMRIWSKNLPYNCDTGIEFYGRQGMLFVSKRGKLQVWNESNQLVENPQPDSVPNLPASHAVDFLESIIEGRLPAADIETACDSVALVHLANASIRSGQSLQPSENGESITDNEQTAELLGRTYRDEGHWAVPKS